MQFGDNCNHLRGLVLRYADLAEQRSQLLVNQGQYSQAWVEQQSIKGAQEGCLAVEDEAKLMAFGGAHAGKDVAVMTRRVLQRCLESRLSRLNRARTDINFSLENVASLEAQIKGIKGLSELVVA